MEYLSKRSLFENPAGLPLLTEYEQERLTAWNATKLPYPHDQSLPQLFERQVALTPDAIAFVFEGRVLSYRELNEQANQLARYLRRCGIGAEGRVGLCVERSLTMVIGLLGILKAGAAYVPLDPAYPQQRLAFMLDDARVHMLVTQQQLLAIFPTRENVLCLDADWPLIARESKENCSVAITSECLLYITYTSGSTGLPKGVMGTHRAMINRLHWMWMTYPFYRNDVCCQKTALSFLDAVWEIFGPLLKGIRTIIIPDNVVKDPKSLLHTLATHEVSRLVLVPSLLRALMETVKDLKASLPSLKYCVSSGEALPSDLVQRFLNDMPQCVLLNLYGSSEVAADVTWYDTRQDDAATLVRIPIGHPIANTQIYLLDQQMQPVPIGEVGELYVAGVGLARGYFNCADLTAERFVPNPFSSEAGARLYRTGDLARHRQDGSIEYLGRLDQQVKIRGFRIELAEVEAALRQSPLVGQTVVTAREDVAGEQRLVGYLVPADQDHAPTLEDLRNFLQQKLPSYMIPAVFVLLAALPLTPSGKVNRLALPAPDMSRPELQTPFAAPATPIEELLAGIYSELLAIERVGRDDNFFALGGHSLLATKLISRLRSTLQVELPLRSLFEAPTVAALSKHVSAALADRQPEQALPVILPRRHERVLPLSFAQQRLWFLDQLQPNTPFYNISTALHLHGPLKPSALQESINEIVRRHEILRTTFAMREPQQLIATPLTIPLPVVDLRPVAQAERAAEIQRLSEQQAQQPFELAHGPLLRTLLLQLTHEEHVLLLTVHHIVFDGWSMQVFMRELAAFYAGYVTGEPVALPELAIQYADFVLWQRTFLQGELLASELSYWQEQLADLPVLALPTDRTRPAHASLRGAHHRFVLSEALTQQLTVLSQQQSVTLFMTLLAAFQTLLSRYSGEPDIVVGSPIANRTSTQVEDLIGFFVNTLVLRSDLGGDPTFCELLVRVREMALGAYAHQHLPFEKLVEVLQPERHLSHNPLFQVMFVLQDEPISTLLLPDLTVRTEDLSTQTAKFDLTLAMWEQADRLLGEIEYNTDLFDAATISRLQGHLLTLLDGIAAHPEQRLSQLPLLTEAEQQQILFEWNTTDGAYARDLCLHQLFEAQVERTPEAVALIFAQEQFNYRQLNQQANQLAHYLQILGVGPEVPVGICMERGPELIVGALGILKAGGVYVPLDPDYPKDRLAFMLANAQAAVLLTQQRFLERLPVQQSGVVCLDRNREMLSRQQKHNPVSEVKAENLAYVIYTSGSTGQPKGAMNTHRGICNTLLWNQMTHPLMAKDRVLLQASFSFDGSMWELFWPLVAGSTIVLTEQGAQRDGAFLVQLMATQRVTVAHFVPTMMKLLLQESTLERCSSLERIHCGGEALPSEMPEQCHTRLKASLHNQYGPSEAAVHTTYWDCRAGSGQITVPIGRPIANTQVYLLDAHLQPVPVGIVGELYIGGIGLARGYISRADLTAERFMPNPFSSEPGARLYKTGDLARYLPDGILEFIGRSDQQVKVRGFRIELAEIEATLKQSPLVQEAVVVVRDDAMGEQRLVGYLVLADQDHAPMLEHLRSFLQEKLPDYMIPTAFVLLQALPLSPNGKVDRQALPAPDMSRAELQTPFAAPATPIEELLAGIYSELLAVERVGRDDNFFALGGHSLLATRLISRLRNVLQVELPLRSLFEAPTVAALSKHVSAALADRQPEQALPVILPRRHEAVLPLSFAQQRLWFLDQLQPNTPFYNISTALHLHGPLKPSALQESINEIVRRHEILRTTFVMAESEAQQLIATTLTIPLSVIDLRPVAQAERAAEVQRLSEQQAQQPFELARGPLVRTLLLQLTHEEHVLLLTVHHIVFDGWSMQVFMHELAAFYAGYAAGKPLALPELAIQYADFALWQRTFLQGELLASELSYWQEQLADLPVLALPTDRTRPAHASLRGAHHRFALSEALTQQLKVLSQQQSVTLFMTLLAAFQTLLSRYSREPDIVVGSPIANRTSAQVEDLIGFFVNTLVLRSDLGGDPTFCELLVRVREVALGAYAHQHLPFEKLVEVLQPERSLSHNPLFQVMFVLQDAPISTLVMSDLIVQAEDLSTQTAKFDLTLAMWEQADRLLGEIEYNTDLFDAATISRLQGHLLTLLDGIVAHPQQHLSQLPLLTQTEQQQILCAWNDTSVPYPTDRCIHQLFEAQVALTPNAIAVAFEDCQLTYAELNHCANQLARYLSSLLPSAQTEMLVGLCIERSVEVVIALLAILKAAGAYVPLEASYPKERLAFILANTRLPILLTQQHLLARLPEHSATVVCIDSGWEAISKERTENLSRQCAAEDLAYVIYTSGSTGRPKGVAVTHRAVNRLVCNTNYIDLDATDCVAQVSNASFDAATFEIWGALLLGGKLVIITKDVALSPRAFVEQLRIHHVTTLFLTTALFNQISRELPAGFRTLKHVLFGGEAVDPHWVREVLKHGPPARLLHVYGPTESTTYATWHLIQDVPDDALTIPIGTPLANTTCYVLNESRSLVPVGIPGELYIGGDGLARGYLNSPELTAERFVLNPFSNEPGARLYKTGDLVRYQRDGAIEFLGRIDHQVKIRGFRIELGEIEAALDQHPVVQESVVLARQDVTGEKRLVAYIVPARQDHTPALEPLRSFLQEKLPDYMIPTAFVLLQALPLSPNGKVDRQALPAPDMSRPELQTPFVAPRTPIEELLAGIYSELLAVEPVGRDDNFFALGGHSLLATRLISRLRSTLQVELPLRSLFEAPTVAALSKHVSAALADRQPEQALPVILPRRHEGVLPLSFAQQRLWFLDQLQPNTPFYNITTALHLHGPLKPSALQESINEIVRRHEILRTTFVMAESEAQQLIAATLTLALPVVDLRSVAQAEREAEVQRLSEQQAQQPFELTRGPLVRTLLLQLTHEEHVLLLTVHHIVFDGWSMQVFMHELAAFYAGYAAGKPVALPQLAIQYADFALWQRTFLQGELLASELSYWQEQLADLPVLALPTDRTRPAHASLRGAHHRFVLSEALTQQLKVLSQQQSVTLFMTLLAAFQTLLSRYSGQHDIAVGSPIANRTSAQVEDLIGFFVNTLVLRSDLGGDPTFCELLVRVRELALGAYAHQHLPFEKLVEVLQPERHLSHNPLFQVMFVLQDELISSLAMSDLTVRAEEVCSKTAKFDLTLSMWEQADGLVGEIEYNTDLFDAATISRLQGHLLTLLDGIVADPQQHLSQLPFLTEAEREQLLITWNTTDRAYPKHQCLHQLFEAQVERTPEAVALIFEQEQLTYRQLNRQANQLAHYLQSLGVGPEIFVGICMKRCLELVIGILGILKAAGVYVPLDPVYPLERLSFMLTDAHISVLLTQRQLLAQLPAQQARIVCLDAMQQVFSQYKGENPISEVNTENLAYAIYTSGSTGHPKGVMNTHQGVCNTLLWLQETKQLSQDDCLVHKTSLSFDLSVEELFWPLMAGARLVIAHPESYQESTYLLSLIKQYAITVLDLVPSVLQMLLEEPGWSACQSVRLVICGGETLAPELQKRFFASHSASLLNTYGPTEAAIDATFWHCQCNNKASAVPIGRPIANTQIYLLDKHLQPVPVGVPAEVYIGGVNLARGYLDRADLTAERFVPHPFAGIVPCVSPGARIYRTGDLARYRSDGTIEYLGRIDQQVKLRGLRIELGEIAVALSQHPAVRENVVLVQEDMSGEKRLVAYIIPACHDIFPTIEHLSTFLQEKLPSYMIPTAFMLLQALPLLPSGKLDQRALPTLSSTRPELQGAFATPRDSLELQLLHIWEELLDIHPVGVTDNFFDLGGHSLLAVRLMARIQQQFGRNLPLATLFQRSGATIEALASILRQQSTSSLQTPLVEIQPRGTKRPLFLVHPVGGTVFCYVDLARALGSDQPLYGIQAQGISDEEEQCSHIEQLASYYIKAVRALQPQGPYLLGGWSLGGVIAFEMAQQLLSQGQEVALLALLDSWVPTSTSDTTDDDDVALLAQFAIDMLQYSQNEQNLPLLYERLRQLGPDEQLHTVLEQTKLCNFVPPDTGVMHIQRLFRVFKANTAAMRSYTPKAYPKRVVLFQADERPVGVERDAVKEWRELVVGGVELQVIPGDHFTMLSKPLVQVLALQLKSYLCT